MKTFNINDNLTIVCQWQKTRMAFKHTAIMLRDGREIDETKICYQNRTWEAYEFESVIEKILDRAIKAGTISEPEVKEALARFRTGEHEKINKSFGALGAIMKMGEVLSQNIQEANSHKLRMLRAQFGDALTLPEDWVDLSEETKAIRLDAVQNNLLAIAK